MAMAIPRVTKDCTIAVMQKATQQDMAEFGVEILEILMKEQPALCQMLTFMTMEFACHDDLPEEVKMSNALTMTVIAGCIIKAINAQIESEEMASLFSEEEGEVV